jgi:hypothetical protein
MEFCKTCCHVSQYHVNGTGKCVDYSEPNKPCSCLAYVKDDSRITSTTGKEIDPNGINHPAHYNKHPSGVECIDIIRHHSHNVGAAIKYLWRAGLKDGESNLKDLKKALWYLQDEIAREEKNVSRKDG